MLWLKIINIKLERTINVQNTENFAIYCGGYNFFETGKRLGLETGGELMDIERGTAEVLALSFPCGASEAHSPIKFRLTA